MDPLYFRTAFPFGYAIFWLGLAVLTLGGAGVAVLSLVRRPRTPLRAVVAAVTAALAAFVAAVNVRAEESLDGNPHPLSTDSVTGRWVGRNLSLELRADSTFRCHPSPSQDPCAEALTGRWHLAGDMSLMFQPVQPDSVLRFRMVRYEGVLHLIVDPVDPDMWDGTFRFRREPTAAR